MILSNKRIFITGGAGYLGRAIIKKLYQDNQIVVYSRDEAKHYFLKKQFPNIICEIGDVYNYERMKQVAIEYNCNIGIFCASLKQIEACDDAAEEAGRTIYQGAINSKKLSKECFFLASCFVSSDKSCAPSTLYGQLKAAAETSFVYKENDKKLSYLTAFSSCRYGNVAGSTGSQLKLMWDAIRNNYTLKLFSEEMTRFFITVEDAVGLIQTSLHHKNEVIIPNLPSYLIKDSFELYAEEFGLKYELGQPRPNEKLHEVMISREELPRTNFVADINKPYSTYYTIGQSVKNNPPQFKDNEFSSRNVVVSKEEFRQFLIKNDWFR